jgi:hypothetical protein
MSMKNLLKKSNGRETSIAKSNERKIESNYSGLKCLYAFSVLKLVCEIKRITNVVS